MGLSLSIPSKRIGYWPPLIGGGMPKTAAIRPLPVTP